MNNAVDRIKTQLRDRDDRPDRPTIRDLIEGQRGEIAKALPAHLDPDRLLRVALTVVKTTHNLASCSAESLLGALMTSAQVGLEPGPLGHCWFIPRRAYDRNRNFVGWECHWEIGYTGIQELARRSGQVGSIEARPIYADDEFSFRHGSDPYLHHVPSLDRDRGDRVGFYAYVEVLTGRDVFRVMALHEVERIRDDYGGGGDSGPWVTDFDAMAAKTVVRAMRNYIPQSPAMAQAFNVDGTVRTDISPDVLDAPRRYDLPAVGDAPAGEGPEDDDSGSERSPAVEAGSDLDGGEDPSADSPAASPAAEGSRTFPTAAEIDAASYRQLGEWLDEFDVDCDGRSTDARREALHLAEPFETGPPGTVVHRPDGPLPTETETADRYAADDGEEVDGDG